LGTRNSLVFVPKKGVVLQEPSVVAVDLDDNKILAVGREANEMIGRTPDTIRVYRPMKDGVIADFVVTQAMIRYLSIRFPVNSVSSNLNWLSVFPPVSLPLNAVPSLKRA